MHKFEDYFSEVSKKSITRVAFVWLIFNATCMGWYTLVYGSENALEAGGIVTSISTVAAGLKLYQKGQENKRENKTDQ
jgi:hypothetical protein